MSQNQAESTVEINVISSENISLGDIICEIVATFDLDGLNEVAVSFSTPLWYHGDLYVLQTWFSMCKID